MLSLPDIFWVLRAGFASLALSMAFESILLGLTDLAWSLKFVQPKQNFLNRLVTVPW